VTHPGVLDFSLPDGSKVPNASAPMGDA
jgi:hypothetical protein